MFRNGRDWGTCNGACGAVETFRACADISILAENTNYTTPERPSTTTAAPTTTSSNSGETTGNNNGETTTENSNNTGDTCRAIGAWSGQADVDEWCTDNCLAPAPYTNCPGNMCECWQGAAGLGAGAMGTSCVATGAWTGDSGMATWCNNNCLHDPPFCPEEMCNCS